MTQEEVLQEEKRFDEWYASQRDIFAKFESPAKNIAWSAWQAAQQQRAADSRWAVAICPRCACTFDINLPAKS